MADGSSLMVKTDSIAGYGRWMVRYAGELDTNLDALATKMGELTSAWKDTNSPEFISKFSEFITAAKTIDADLLALGNFIQEMATKYDSAVETALGSMV